MRKGENVFLVMAICLGLFVLFGSYNVKPYVKEPLTPAVYATAITGLLIFCSTARIISNLIKMRKDAESGEPVKMKEITVENPKILIFQGVAMVLFGFGMSKVGFYTSTFLYLAISLCVLSLDRSSGWKRKLMVYGKYALGSLVFTCCLSQVMKIFNIFLPNTPLW